jgi:type I restriction enzyme S subunit
MAWEEKSLDKLIKINHKSLSRNYNFLDINYYDISSIGTGIKGEPKYYKIDDIPSRAKRIIDDGDIIISTVRPINKSFYYCKDTKYNDVVSTGFAVLSANDKMINSRFLYYIISTQSFTNYLVSQEQGATYPAITPDTIKNAKIKLPPLETQKKIVNLISNYDDLIENNNKRIKLLESMAEELFKEWFVRLRFPNYQNTKIEDGIPQGWERVTVDSLLKQLKGTVKIKTSEMLTKGRFPVIDQSKDFIAGYTNEKDINYFEGIPFIVFGDHTRVLKLINFSFAKGADGVQVLVSNNERMPQLLFYHNLLNVDLSNFHYSRHLKFLKKEKVLLPTKKIANEFNSFTENLYKEIDLLRGKNQTLKQTRDLLLPRLLSGKLDIEKLDIN